jgi:hypothetical protein
MKANFGFAYKEHVKNDQAELDNHARYLANANWSAPGTFREEPELPPGFERFEKYYCVDVLGKEFVWMNETFPKEKFAWYLWFESVFLVPGEMATFLRLRWQR